MIRTILLVLATAAAFLRPAVACTVSTDSVYDFSAQVVSTPPASTEIVVNVVVNCPAGVNYRLYPRSTSTNSVVYLALTNNGSPNGNIYMFHQRLDGTIMLNSNTSTHISGTGTGADQVHQVKVFLANAPSNPSQPISRLGTFNTSSLLWTVRRLDNNTTFNSPATQITGQVIGSCNISSAGDVDFGTIESSSLYSTHEKTSTLAVTCDNGIAYKIYADHPNSPLATWVSGSIRPVPAAPSDFTIGVRIKPTESNTWSNLSTSNYYAGTGTGGLQNYDLRFILSVAANKRASFTTTIRPTLRF